jgi:hypothetical protein
VKESGKSFGVPLDYKRKQLVVSRTQIVTDRAVAVTNFKHEPAYTPANDPARKGSEAIQTAIAMTDNTRMMEEKVIHEPEKVTVFDWKTMQPKVVDSPLRPQMERQLQMAQSSISGPLGVGGQAEKMAEEKAAALFDALEVQFELSSPTPIKNAYVVVMANYHTTDHPKDSEMWLAAKAVGAIDSNRHQVWLREGGLPPGYVLENVHLHVYEHGTEIATDLSENRAALTRDEAHEYLMIEHLSAHKTDTVSARIVLIRLPADWATHPRDPSFLKTFFVKVDKTGHAVDAFEDETCETKVSHAYYDAVLRDQLFLPALERGQPVESVAKVKLTKFSS